jgi:Enoyl-(Acyl carrier protein) reductase
MSPFGRLGQPAEIAAVVAFLAGDAASWVTAQNIKVNGAPCDLFFSLPTALASGMTATWVAKKCRSPLFGLVGDWKRTVTRHRG